MNFNLLSDVVLPTRQNQIKHYSGIDAPNTCMNRAHFDAYPHKLDYRYNSRGFRDQEWPDTIDQLKDAIWCVGDSFTIGFGAPLEHTWPYLLEKATQRRCINFSLAGASPDWVARRGSQVLREIQPKLMIIHWPDFHRGEIDGADDELKRKMHTYTNYHDQVTNWIRRVDEIVAAQGDTKIIHSLVPTAYEDIPAHWNVIAGSSWPKFPSSRQEFDQLPAFIHDELKGFNFYNKVVDYYAVQPLLEQTMQHINCMPKFKNLDISRDGHHYDILSAQQFVSDVLQKI